MQNQSLLRKGLVSLILVSFMLFFGTLNLSAIDIDERVGPTISSTSPNETSTVSIGVTYFQLDFDLSVSVASGEARLVNSTTGAIVKTVEVSNYGNSNSTNQYFYMSGDYLEPSTTYHLEIDAGTYVDAAGNSFEGISDDTSWTFTTEDARTEPPVVSGFSPSLGGSNISIAQKSYYVFFSTPINSLTGEVRLIKNSTDEVLTTTQIENNIRTNTTSAWIYFQDLELMEPETQYYLEIDEGAFEDLYGNTSEAIGGASTWSFTTEVMEDEAPVANYFSPSHQSTDVSVSTNYFQISFDEPVSASSGEARLINSSTSEVVKTASFSTYSVSNSQYHGFNFNENDILEPNTTYHIEVDANVHSDVFGNLFEGISDSSTWAFTTEEADTNPPVIANVFPNNGESDVVLNRHYFELYFDKAVTTIDGEARLIKTATDEVVKTADLGDYVNTNSTYQYFNFNNELLEPSTSYHIEIDADSYEDVFGNLFEGISDSSVWSFTTQEPDTDPPLALDFFPENDATGIQLGQTFFRIRFDELVTDQEGEARIIKTETGEVVKSTVINQNSNENSNYQYLYFDAGLLEASTQYHLEIDANSYVDLFGNLFEGISDSSVWAFTTEEPESDPPVLTYVYPNNGETGVSIARNYFEMNFDEAVTTVGGEAKLIKTATNEVIKTTDLSNYVNTNSVYQYFYFDNDPLEPSTVYHIEMDADSYEDVFGNLFEGISDSSVWAFTTQEADTIPPVTTNFYPQNGETDVSITRTGFDIYFDKAVTSISGEAKLIKTETGEVVKTANLTDYVNTNSTYQFIRFSDEILEPSTNYHIEIDANSYEDVFGNLFEGISDSSTWAFTTEEADTNPPVITNVFPNNGESDVDLNRSYFQLYFDKAVSTIGGEARLIKTATDEVIKTSNLSDYLRTNSTYHYFYFNNDLLEPSTNYHIEIDANSYEDLFGNLFEGVADSSAWAFTTRDPDTDPPVALDFFPENNNTGIQLGQTFFRIRFDEPVTNLDGEARIIKTETGEVVKTTSTNQNSNENSDYQYLYFDADLLEASTQYHIEIDTDSYVDVFGNLFAGISDSSVWAFTTEEPESDPPVLTYLYPNNGETGVSVTRNYFEMNFDEAVTTVGGEARLIKTTTNEVVKTADLSDFVNTNSVYQYINFDNDPLEPSTVYHIEMDADSYEDVFGNLFEGISDSSVWAFTTQEADTIPPVANNFYPQNGETDVSITRTGFDIYFNKAVTTQGGEARLVKTETGEVVKTANLTDYVNTNSTYQFIRFSDGILESSTNYHIEIDADSYQDIFGNLFEGISDSSTWAFTTEEADTNPPVITNVFPNNGEIDVDLNRSYFELYFDKAVTTIGGEARLIKTATDEVIKTANLADYERTNSTYQYFYFNNELLEPSTNYHIEIDANSYEDLFGNLFEGVADSSVWAFTTRDPDTEPPIIETLFPADGAVDVSLSQTFFRIRFDEPVTNLDGEARIIKTETGEVVKTTSTNQNTNENSNYQYLYFDADLLEAATLYHIEIDTDSYEDIFGNLFEGVADSSVWAFTTQEPESDPPVLTYVYPNNGETNVSVARNYFEMNFDEAVTTVGGEARLIKTATDEVVKTADLNDFFNPNSVYQYINFDNDPLEPSTVYHIEMDADSYEDVFGNLFEGISDSSVWAFTTQEADTIPPVANNFYPQNGETNVSITRRGFDIYFDKAVTTIGGEARLIKTETGEVVKTANLTDYVNTNSTYQFIRFSDGILESSTNYHIEIDADSYQDVFGNLFEGISDSSTWAFTTEEADTNPPVITDVFPNNGEIDVDLNRSYFELYFDKAVTTIGGEARLIKTATDEVIKTANLADYVRTNSTYQYFYFNNELLEPSTNYHIEIDANSYEDLFGNLFEGVADSSVWAFTAKDPDTDPPVIETLFPADGAVDVPLSQTFFRIRFDEPVTSLDGEARIIKTETGEVVKTTSTNQNTNENSNYQYLYFDADLLEAATLYHIEIETDSYEDIFGNLFGGIADSSVWAFTTEEPESDPPVLTYVYPDNGETGVSVTRNYFEMNFDEAVTTVGGEARLIKTATDEVVKTADLSNYVNTNSVYQYFYFDNDPLEPSTVYHIEMDADSYEDVFGNLFEGISDSSVWAFTTQEADTIPPIATTFYPQNGETGVSLTRTGFDIYFDKAVTTLGGEARLIETETGEVVKTANLGDFVNTNSTYQYFWFNNDFLEPATDYHIEIDADSYQDVFGNLFEGISDSSTWAFTTEEARTEHPALISTYPTIGATDVAIGLTTIRLDFEEPTSAAFGEVRLIKTTSDEVVGSWNPGNTGGENSYNFYFSLGSLVLEATTTYHIEVEQGSFIDIFGNEFEGIDDSTFSFTTQSPELIAPAYAYFYPENGSTDVAVTLDYLQLGFDESTNSLEGEIRLVHSGTGEVIKSIDIEDSPRSRTQHYYFEIFPNTLEPATTYHIEIDDAIVEDLFGNTSQGFTDPTIWTFDTETADEQSPVAIDFRPTNNADEVSIGRTGFTLIFDEDVRSLGGSAYLHNADSDEQIGTLQISAYDRYSIAHSFYYSGDVLDTEQSYYVLVDSGTFADAFGNEFEGIGDSNEWVFTTQAPETDAPQVIYQWPNNGASGVALGNEYFYLSFDESVRAVGGTASLVESATGEVHETSSIAQFGHADWQTIHFDRNLMKPETAYHILIDEGAYEDLFGNPFAGFDEDDWSFTTEASETVPPSLVSSSPSNGDLDVDLGLNEIQLIFDEPVVASGTGGVQIVETATSTVVKENKDIHRHVNSYQYISLGNTTLKSGTEYHVEVDSGAFQDIFGNPFGGVSAGEITFTSIEADDIAPNASFYSPTGDEVAIGTNYFYLLFDEPVIPGEGNIRLVQSGTGEVIDETTPYTFASASENHGFDFGDLILSPNTTYHIEIDAGSYKDLFDNDYAGISDSLTWMFTTEAEETDPPEISFLEPANNRTDVLVSTEFFYIYFDETVEAGDGEVRIINTDSSEEVATASPDPNRKEQYQSIHFEDLELEPGTNYHLEIDAGSFVDLYGNDFEGITENDVWAFRTEAAETTPPEIFNLRPETNATEISVDTRFFQIEFDEVVKSGIGDIRLIETSTGDLVAETIASSNGESTFQSLFFSMNDLEIETQYHIEIDSGAFVDLFGNAFTGIDDETTWSFTTQSAETDPPLISYQFPIDGAEGVALSNTYFYLAFSEPVQGNGEYIRIIDAESDEEYTNFQALDFGLSEYYTFRLSENELLPGKPYYIKIDSGAFVDVFGNAFVGIDNDTDWNFTSESAETDPPEIEWINPDNGSTEINIGQRLFQVSFNEKVQAQTGNARIINTSTGEEVKSTDLISNSLSEYQTIYFDESLLAPNTTYHIEIDEGLFEDVFGNVFSGINDDETWSFSTEGNETDAPEIEFLWPRNGAIGQSLGQQNFYLYFNEPVASGTGAINLHNAATDEVVKTTEANDFGLNQYQGFSFDDELLDPNTSYYITIESGVYKDVYDNVFEGIATSDSWSFRTENTDNDAPQITPLFPRNFQDNIPVDITFFQISFDEVVLVGNGDINIVKTSTGDVVKTTSPSEDFGTSIYQGFVVSNDALEEGTDYHIEMASGTYVDAFGNDFEGISSSDIWSFTTAGTSGEELLDAAPQINSVFPENGSSGIALDVVAFNMTFNEAVSVEDGEIRLLNTTTGETVATTTANDFGTSRVQSFFFEDLALETSTQYHIEMDEGLYTNEFDIPFAGIDDRSVWSFTTVDINGPEIIQQSPENNATGVVQGISEFEVTFDEDVNAREGDIRLINSLTGETVATTTPDVNPNSSDQRFSFNANLEPFVTYYIEIDEGTYEDLSGNAFAGIFGISGWSFTTSDTESPEISATTPATNTEDVDLDVENFSVTFNENVIGKDGQINLIETSTGTVVKTTTSGTDSGTEMSITFPSGDLDYQTSYHIEIAAGAYEDDFGNGFAGISDQDTWSFVTEIDETRPFLSSTNPADESTDIARDFEDFSMTFNKEVTAIDGTIRLFDYTSSDEIASTIVSGTGTTFNFNFDVTLTYGASYYIEISEGAFEDNNGITNDAYKGSDFWFFTIEGESVAPGISSLSPTNGSEDVELDVVDFTITFDENVTAQDLGIKLIESNSGDVLKTTTSGTSSGTSFTITFSEGNLDYQTSYYLEIEAGAYVDNYENAFAGITDSNTWSFTTKADDTPPVVTATVPENGSTGVALNFDDFSITFDKSVTASTGDINLIDSETGTIVASATSSGNGETISLTFGYAFTENTTYFIEMEEGAFIDELGNKSEAMTGSSNWSFTTAQKEEEEEEEEVPVDQTIDFSAIVSKTYGDNSFELSASASSGLSVTFTSSDETVISISENVATIVGAGTVSISASQVGNDAYNAAETSTQQVSVEKAVLSIEPLPISSTFGESIPQPSFNISGFVNGEDESVLTELPTVSFESQDLINVGAYNIVVSGGVSDNYSFTYGISALTIVPAIAEITVSDLTQEEDGTPKLPLVATNPADLNYVLSFDGFEVGPTAAGEYEFTVTIDEQNYIGSVTNTLIITEAPEVLGITNGTSIQFYPNPAQNFVNLVTEKQNVAVTIFTLTGTKVMEITNVNQREQIDISSLNNGVYLLQVKVKDELIYESRLMKK